MSEFGEGNNVQELERGVNLSEAYGGRFIYASEAEGQNTEIIRSANFTIPVSYAEEDKRFRLTGLEVKEKLGVIVSGIISEDSAKINHILVDGKLRGGEVSKALLENLEAQFLKQGKTDIYAVFANPKTVEFFVKKGFEVINHLQLKPEIAEQLDINLTDLDSRVASVEDFIRVKKEDGASLRQVLMYKHLK